MEYRSDKLVNDPQPMRLLVRNIDIMKLYRSNLERELNKTGVFRSQHQILMYISDHSNASQKDIARMHNVSTATIAVTMKKLEKGGYIRREVDESDNRFNQIYMTDKGKAALEKSKAYFQVMERKMFEGFSEEEMDILEGYYIRIFENLKSALPEAEKEEVNL